VPAVGPTSETGAGPGRPGAAGTLGQGDAGSKQSAGFGGDGGGGQYGGGGGGTGAYAVGDEAVDVGGGGGGGGGSSLAGPGGSVSANPADLPPQVTISYAVPSSPTACSGDSATTAYEAATTVTFSCSGTGLVYSPALAAAS
jgi:hypothetical protein